MNKSVIIESKQKSIQKQDLIPADKAIVIKGAREHNLQNIDITIPKNRLVVVTGVSGSGKSSLIIDTLYAEGQRRYVESLSSYARQFLVRMNKPEVDYITGICPAIAIEQKVTAKSSRSTVGSLTEIYDYLKLLYARVGKTYSPVSGKLVKKKNVSDVTDFIINAPEGSKIILKTPLKAYQGWEYEDIFNILVQKGFSRVIINGQTKRIEDLDISSLTNNIYEKGYLLIDRYLGGGKLNESINRISDSIMTAFHEGEGKCYVWINGQELYDFSNRFELDGINFEEPSPEFFSFNNPYGACKKCEGFGSIIGIDDSLVFPDKNLSVFEEAIACWRGEKMSNWSRKLISEAINFDFPVHRPIKELTQEQYDLLWQGNPYFEGLNDFFRHLEESSYKIQYRVMLSRYRGRTGCPECRGTRIRKDASYVKVGQKSIIDLVRMPISELNGFFKDLELNEADQVVAKRLLYEINNRLGIMQNVGLGYLMLNRLSNSLSGGETQRINLTRTLGSNLTSSLYILDEPSIGLHPKDTYRLIKVLIQLRDIGNTVVVVEHDEDIMRAADHIIDMGPLAGRYGGKVIASGNYNEIAESNESLTSDYLNNRKNIPVPKVRRPLSQKIKLTGASQHNLNNIEVTIPLNSLVVVTGVSGSGKTTLIRKILYPALYQLINGQGQKPGSYEKLTGDLQLLQQVEMIDQNPIGRSSRSNPVTYVKAFDAIRDLYSRQQVSKVRGYKPKHFSFNIEGGRCETCKGEGEITVEMQFLADIHLECEECSGKRFKAELLDVTYNGKNIFEVLEMSVDDALSFFANHKDIKSKLQPLSDVGLGYVHLGQSSSTLSGGEAQRVKLAFFLTKGRSGIKQLFIFDEPTTGLHFHDINKLLVAFNALIEQGHSIIVIEHNLDVIKTADWIIDLGPDGGSEGGNLVFEGVPEDIVNETNSHTGKYLKEKLLTD